MTPSPSDPRPGRDATQRLARDVVWELLRDAPAADGRLSALSARHFLEAHGHHVDAASVEALLRDHAPDVAVDGWFVTPEQRRTARRLLSAPPSVKPVTTGTALGTQELAELRGVLRDHLADQPTVASKLRERAGIAGWPRVSEKTLAEVVLSRVEGFVHLSDGRWDLDVAHRADTLRRRALVRGQVARAGGGRTTKLVSVKKPRAAAAEMTALKPAAAKTPPARRAAATRTGGGTVAGPKADVVWLSAGGEHFHRIEDCRGLVGGQALSRKERGYSANVRTMNPKAARRIGRLACSLCHDSKPRGVTPTRPR